MSGHIHILGIGGTFMAGVAVLARQAGYTVSGQDDPLYPPMSDVLANAGITVRPNERLAEEAEQADSILIGNAFSRGHPAVEAILNNGLRYTSAPAWLAEHILASRWVIAVAGTHGKTTTASLVAWLLEDAGLKPGFLIGGLPGNFESSARLGEAPFFVIEADEYDTAFFDKRSKFIHFHPQTLVLNNLEFDHADIFPDLAAIERQFHHLVRTVPGNGAIICNADSHALDRVIAMGCWSECTRFGTTPSSEHHLKRAANGVWQLDQQPLPMPLPGEHNAMNALAALLAARHAGVPLAQGLGALAQFKGVRRRLELRGEQGGVRVFDDFAHHPTAISATLTALRDQHGSGRVLAVVEPRSNTMQSGQHAGQLAGALSAADAAFVLADPALNWDVSKALAPLGARAMACPTHAALISEVIAQSQAGDTIVVMSNGAFAGIHERLLSALAQHAAMPSVAPKPAE